MQSVGGGDSDRIYSASLRQATHADKKVTLKLPNGNNFCVTSINEVSPGDHLTAAQEEEIVHLFKEVFRNAPEDVKTEIKKKELNHIVISKDMSSGYQLQVTIGQVVTTYGIGQTITSVIRQEDPVQQLIQKYQHGVPEKSNFIGLLQELGKANLTEAQLVKILHLSEAESKLLKEMSANPDYFKKGISREDTQTLKSIIFKKAVLSAWLIEDGKKEAQSELLDGIIGFQSIKHSKERAAIAKEFRVLGDALMFQENEVNKRIHALLEKMERKKLEKIERIK